MTGENWQFSAPMFDSPHPGSSWGNTSNWADILAEYNANVPQMMHDATAWQATQDPSGIGIIPQSAIDPSLRTEVEMPMPTMWANPNITYNMPMISELPDPQKYNYSNIPLIEYKEVSLPIASAVQKAAKGGGRSKGKRGRTTAAPASGPHGGGMTSSESAAAGGYGSDPGGEFGGTGGYGGGMGGFGGWT
tara:strand:+ start:203 stop:775 length:573 start_codon:yes stop_codon:yes gene_type:complete